MTKVVKRYLELESLFRRRFVGTPTVRADSSSRQHCPDLKIHLHYRTAAEQFPLYNRKVYNVMEALVSHLNS